MNRFFLVLSDKWTILSNGVLSSFVSDVGIVQRKLLQNINSPTKIVFLSNNHIIAHIIRLFKAFSEARDYIQYEPLNQRPSDKNWWSVKKKRVLAHSDRRWIIRTGKVQFNWENSVRKWYSKTFRLATEWF